MSKLPRTAVRNLVVVVVVAAAAAVAAGVERAAAGVLGRAGTEARRSAMIDIGNGFSRS